MRACVRACVRTYIYTQIVSLSHFSPPFESLSAGVVAIAAGYYHTCAVLTNGGVNCWGYNSNGQLGTGDVTDRQTPAAVIGLQNGDFIVCARLERERKKGRESA